MSLDADTLIKLWQPMLAFLPRLAMGLVIVLVFWLVGIAAWRITMRFGMARDIDPDLMAFLATVVKVTMVAIGGVTALGTMGIDVAALVTGLGLTGFSFGLALKDTVANVIAGLSTIINKPFRQNDRIAVGTQEGVVQQVNLRYTVLRTTNGNLVFVPNGLLVTAPVTVIK
ncbi:MAG: mechanosensitive ion channel [Planctomycetota bacterium]